MITKTNLKVVDLSVRKDNDNFLHFNATAGYIGKPTGATPCGAAKGFKIVLGDGSNVNELIGAGVNCSYGETQFKQHDKSFKIGVIDNAFVSDDAINVEGHLWKTDFPDVCDTIECSKESLGCSVEVYSYGVVVDDKNKTQTLQDVHFTGMSIVYKSKAAFEGTNFMCSIADKEAKSLSNEELQAAVDKAVSDKFEEFKTAVRAEFTKQLEEFKLSAVKPEEKTTETAIQFDFNKLSETIKAAVKEGLEAKAPTAQLVQAPTRKTQQFASEPQFKDDKSLVELSKEIDDDPSLTPEQKWAAQMRIWNERDRQAS